MNLSTRYITERFLPDKAIDVIDEAASKVYAKLCEEKLGASFLYRAKNFELTEKDYRFRFNLSGILLY